MPHLVEKAAVIHHHLSPFPLPLFPRILSRKKEPDKKCHHSYQRLHTFMLDLFPRLPFFCRREPNLKLRVRFSFLFLLLICSHQIKSWFFYIFSASLYLFPPVSDRCTPPAKEKAKREQKNEEKGSFLSIGNVRPKQAFTLKASLTTGGFRWSRIQLQDLVEERGIRIVSRGFIGQLETADHK